MSGNGFHTTKKANRCRYVLVEQLPREREKKKSLTTWVSRKTHFKIFLRCFYLSVFFCDKAFPSPYSAYIPFPPPQLRGLSTPDLCISSIPPPIPLILLWGNCKGHAGTTAVQPGGGTQGTVKHKANCLSERTKACVSLWGIPLPPLAPCVYNRFVWLEKVMWVKRRKKGRGGG